MSTLRRRLVFASASIVGLLVLSACVAGPGGSPAPTSTNVPAGQGIESARPDLPEGRVIATGTVLDTAGDVQLCLGAVAESYPPQCSGIPLYEWTWDGVDGSETSGDVTWGTYAVYGTYDGERYTNTDAPIMLALYDPIAPEDPTGGVDGTTDETELTRVHDELSSALGTDALSITADRGYVWLEVVWDDGTIQESADAAFGDDVVVGPQAQARIAPT
jgi:hypothetical protein